MEIPIHRYYFELQNIHKQLESTLTFSKASYLWREEEVLIENSDFKNWSRVGDSLQQLLSENIF